MNKKLHKVGKYGSEETNQDEIYSKECAREIYQYLNVHKPIKGYRYMILEDGVPEMLYYKRDGVTIPEYIKQHKIIPDIPTIIIVEIANSNNFYTILSGDDKYQKTGGNAIDRTPKNHRGVFEDKMCYNSDINPYVIMCAGNGIVEEDGTPKDYFNSKFRQMFPYLKNGKPYIWQPSDEHNSSKQEWNQLYLKKDRFTKEEKMKILKTVALQSVEHYKRVLNA